MERAGKLIVCLCCLLPVQLTASDPIHESANDPARIPANPSAKEQVVRGDISAKQLRSRIPDLNGDQHAPLDVQNSLAHVVIFTTTECPIANSYAPEINRTVKQYQDQKIRFYLVHVDAQVSDADFQKHREQYGYTLPVLVDRELQLARAVGATVTPEVAIILSGGKLAYRGCIDDLFANLGQKRQQPRRRFLRQALSEVTAGQPVSTPRTKAVGCMIQYR